MDTLETLDEKKDEIISLFKYLKDLFKNPIKAIKKIPTIAFSSLLIFQFFLCTFSVVISNLFAPYAIHYGQVIVTIVVSFVGISLTALFFYYFFFLFSGRDLSFRSLFTMVLFAHIPFAVFHLFYYFFPLVDLMGMGLSAILMVVGLVENFKIPRQTAIRLMSSLYAVFFVFWILKTIQVYNLKEMSQPQELDAIEREVQSDN